MLLAEFPCKPCKGCGDDFVGYNDDAAVLQCQFVATDRLSDVCGKIYRHGAPRGCLGAAWMAIIDVMMW